MQKRLTILFVFLFPLLYATNIYAQSSDQLFEQARTAAFQDENYEKAIELANKGLELAPEYTELRLFLGKLYFWDGNHADARSTLKKILSEDPTHSDARIALINVELETQNFNRALALANDGLDQDSTNTELLFRKGKALEQLGRTDAAIQQYRYVQKFDPSYPYVNGLIEKLEGAKQNWEARTRYAYDWFSTTFNPWHMGTFELQRNTSSGNIIGRVKYGHRFSSNDYQVGMDAYPILSRNMYAYANIAVSGDTFFPNYRGGLSIFRAFPKSFEASLGLRYLHFDQPNLFVYTASVSKYLEHYWISVQSFFTPELQGSTASLNLRIRRYLNGPHSYLQLRLGGGSSPMGLESERDLNIGSVESALAMHKRIQSNWIINGEVGYSQEEFAVNQYRNRWNVTVGLAYKF